jgi:Mce-associated membrane protein
MSAGMDDDVRDATGADGGSDDGVGAGAGEARPTATGSSGKIRKPTRAERLEAKAAQLRKAEQQAAERAEAQRQARATAVEHDGGAGSGRRRGTLGWLLVAAGVLVVGLAVALALVAVDLGHRDDQLAAARRDAVSLSQLQSLRDSALSSAEKYAVDFGSYDYAKLDHDFQLVSSHLTKSFADKYAQISQQLKSVIVKYKGKSTATVQGAGVTSVTGKEAVVVLFLDQTVSTTQSDKPRVDRNRLTMTLQRQADGTWLISDLELV